MFVYMAAILDITKNVILIIKSKTFFFSLRQIVQKK